MIEKGIASVSYFLLVGTPNACKWDQLPASPELLKLHSTIFMEMEDSVVVHQTQIKETEMGV